MAARRSPWRLHAAVLAVYLALSLALTWPLIAQITTHVPGVPQWAFDESTFVWNIWYFKHALVDNLSTPLHSELIWFPLGIDLTLYTYNFYHVLAAFPLALAVNLPFASNVTLLTSTVLSAYGTWLLVRYLLTKDLNSSAANREAVRPVTSHESFVTYAAFAAGALFAFASNRAVYAALGHYDMVTTQWLPFYVLALLCLLDGRLGPARRRRWAILGGLFFAFTGLAEMISALFLGIFTLITLLVWAWGKLRRTGAAAVDGRSAFVNLLILAGVAFLVWSPALIPILQAFRTADFDLKGWGDAGMLSADLKGWFTPTVLHPLFGGDVVRELRQVQLRAANPELPGFRDVNTVFVGWVSVALALVGAFAYRRKVAVWIWTSVIFGLFTLGPLLQIDGQSMFDLDGLQTTVPLPFILLHFLPVIKANRAPNRNSVMFMLGIAVLAGYGVFWLLEKLARLTQRSGTGEAVPRRIGWITPAVALLLVTLILFEHLAVPLPLSDARIPAVYEQIAADPAQVSVMQVPLGWRNSFGVFGPEQTQLQYFQTGHGKPMLGGNISRAPDFKLDYFRRLPYFQALTEIEFGRPVTPELAAAARAQAADLAYLYDLGYVLLMPPIPDRLPYADTWQAAWEFVKSTLPLEPEPFWAQDGIEAYRVVQPAGDDSFRLDLGAPGTYPYRGEGWDAAETDAPYDVSATWATAAASRLFFPLRKVDPAATYAVRMNVRPFAFPGAPAQTVALAVDGRELERKTLGGDWQEVEWAVPGAALQDGLNRLELRWGQTALPRQVVGGSRAIGSTGVELPVDADLKAFADGGFMALFDEAAAQNDASAGRRGVNVTVLEPRTGRVLEKAGFDTTANEGESERLAQFLADVDPGRIVLVASFGDAGAHLTEAAGAGLRSIGADVTLDGLQDNYFAVVGVKDAAPGTAVQAVDPNEAFVRVSLNPDRRALAAAVDWVEIGP